jgi:hypothetical protein
MQYHVFAVWDFMSLLKSLQINLTCVDVPWVVKGDANTRYLINEIVTGEESDVDMKGNRLSHFELYLQAMEEAQADTSIVKNYIDTLLRKKDLKLAFKEASVPAEAQVFITNTFEVIATGKPHVQAAVFTFGREDLIPNMFISIIDDMSSDYDKSAISTFKYYLERHIEVDGDHHSKLALDMTSILCGDDLQKWAEAEAAVLKSLQSRIDLWNGVLKSIKAVGKPVAEFQK